MSDGRWLLGEDLVDFKPARCTSWVISLAATEWNNVNQRNLASKENIFLVSSFCTCRGKNQKPHHLHHQSQSPGMKVILYRISELMMVHENNCPFNPTRMLKEQFTRKNCILSNFAIIKIILVVSDENYNDWCLALVDLNRLSEVCHIHYKPENQDLEGNNLLSLFDAHHHHHHHHHHRIITTSCTALQIPDHHRHNSFLTSNCSLS